VSDKETVESLLSYYTQRAGDVCRQLGLAGIGVIWLLHTSTPNAATPPSNQPFAEWQRRALIWLTGALALDALQYILGTVIWGWKYLLCGKGSEEVSKHLITDGILTCIVVVKLVVTAWGLCIIAGGLWHSPLFMYGCGLSKLLCHCNAPT
jgi:hypothetical protein